MFFNRTGRLIETLEYLLVLSVKILISRPKFEFWNSVYQEPVLLCLVPSVHRTVVRKQSHQLHSAQCTTQPGKCTSGTIAYYVLLHMQSYCSIVQSNSEIGTVVPPKRIFLFSCTLTFLPLFSSALHIDAFRYIFYLVL